MAGRIGRDTRGTAGELSAVIISALILTLKTRHLAIVGKSGHVATFDWQTGTLHTELQLRETCQDITYAHLKSHLLRHISLLGPFQILT
jgi:hypothetical protein